MDKPNLPLRPSICCGYPVDAGESFATMLGEMELDPDPHAGDIGICLNCGAYLVYLDDANNCRFAQLLDLNLLSDKRRRQLKKARKYVQKRGRIWPDKKGGERFSPN
jgi:hypothetical protein